VVDDAELAAALAKEAIREVIARYFDAVGRRAWDEVLACFTPGAYADYEFDAERRIEVQVELLQRGIRRFDASTLMGSHAVVTVGSGRASSVSTALTAHRSPPERGERIRLSAVRYTDEWVEQPDGGWKISRRAIETMWRAWLDPRDDDRAGDHRHADEW
jgi:hypothetical protein